jgi:hypothetical protein
MLVQDPGGPLSRDVLGTGADVHNRTDDSRPISDDRSDHTATCLPHQDELTGSEGGGLVAQQPAEKPTTDKSVTPKPPRWR